MSHFYRVMFSNVDTFLHFNVNLKQIKILQCALFCLFDTHRAYLLEICQALQHFGHTVHFQGVHAASDGPGEEGGDAGALLD